MTETKYFVQYSLRSDWITGVYVLVGETPKYYKIRSTSDKDLTHVLLISKNFPHFLRGSDVKYYELPEEEVRRKIARQKAIRLAKKTDFSKLSDSQLERVKTILEEK